jgi:hypothetical protein
MRPLAVLTLISLLALPAGASSDQPQQAEADPYQHSMETAPEFRPVRQVPEFLIGRWDTWIHMPWRHRWTIGTGEAGGLFCRDHGINGGFTDHGQGDDPRGNTPAGPRSFPCFANRPGSHRPCLLSLRDSASPA